MHKALRFFGIAEKLSGQGSQLKSVSQSEQENVMQVCSDSLREFPASEYVVRCENAAYI